MKKKCCHVRMLSPNKSCRKDNLDRVIYVQQHNYPLINQQLRESKKIQAAIHIYMYMLPLKGHEANPQSCLNQAACCATQRETKWQAPERKAEKYGPATIREAHIAVSEILGRLCFNTAAFRGC